MRKPNKSIAFDIGSKYIKIVEGRKKNNHLYIENYTIIPTPKDTVSDGIIYQKDKLTEIIYQYVRENKIKKSNIMISINSGKCIIRDLELPKMKEEELKEAVKFELEYLLPQTIKDYIIDYTIIEECEIATEGEVKVSILKVQAIALPKYIILDYVDVFEKPGLNIHVVDIQANNFIRALSNGNKLINIAGNNREKDESIAIVDLGHEKTSVTIIVSGKIFLHRFINIGGRDITNIIAQTLGIDFADAEKWKIKNDYLFLKDSEELSFNLEPCIKDLMQEIDKIIQFFISKNFQRKKLGAILLVGGGAKTKDICQCFESHTNIPTILGNDHNYINVEDKNISFYNELLYFSSTIGILMREG